MSTYRSYKCRRCRKDIILLTDQVKMTLKEGKYITCAHCGSKNIVIDNMGDTLNELMKHDSYRRENGVIKQRQGGEKFG